MLRVSIAGAYLVTAFIARWGGDGMDLPAAIVLDERDGVFVAGSTNSRDLPVTTGKALNGNWCAFATKLAARSGAMRYSTVLCTRDMTFAFAAAPGLRGELWVAGSTDGPNLPVTSDAAQPRFGGSSEAGGAGDAILLRWSADGGTLRYATYFGGGGDERANALIADGEGGVWMGGSATASGATHGFLAHFDAGGRLIATRSQREEVTAMTTVGANRFAFATTGPNGLYGSIFVYRMGIGSTETAPADALAGGLAGGGSRQINRLRFRALTALPDGSIVAAGSNEGCGDHPARTDGWILIVHPGYRTRDGIHCLGGAGVDEIHGVAAARDGSVWVTGLTDSRDFPVTTTRAGATPGDDMQAFLAQLNPRTGAIRYATLLGANPDPGRGIARGHAVAVSKYGGVFATGETAGGSWFRPTSGAFHVDHPGASADIYVVSAR
jgi:hypothetical protein